MDRGLFAALLVVALVLGASLPIAVDYVFGPLTTVTRTYTQPPTLVTAPSIPLSGEELTMVRQGLGGLSTFSSFEELAQFLVRVSKLREFLYRGFYRTLLVYSAGSEPALPMPEGLGAGAVTITPTSTATRISGTNVQVVGIDEPDIVKCDGRIVAVASGERVFVVGIPEKRVISVIQLNKPVSGLFLLNKSLVVIAQSAIYSTMSVQTEPTTSVYVYNVTSPDRPVLRGEISITGSLLSARLGNGVVYLVTSQPINGIETPTVNGEPLPADRVSVVDPLPTSYTNVLALDVENLRYSVYSFMTSDGSWLYMSPTRLYIASLKRPTALDTYLYAINATLEQLQDPSLAMEVGNLVAQGDIDDAVELLAKALASLPEDRASSIISKVGSELESIRIVEKTTFYVLDVNGTEARYRGSFSVDGGVLDQFSMEEQLGGYFVVATTSSTWGIKVDLRPPVFTAESTSGEGVEVTVRECRGDVCWETPITVTVAPGRAGYRYPTPIAYPVRVGETENGVFIVDLENLSIVGELRGLAEGERIYAARLIKNILFLVTFRQVDPLFAIDISDPSSPKVLGYLKIHGFSDYLHPLSDDTMLGIGMENGMLKISLFNISDPTKMSEISKIVVEGWSPALRDHHAVTIDPDYGLLFIPVYLGKVSGILAVSFDGQALSVYKLIEHVNAVRSLYVGNELFTVSQSLVKVLSMPSLELLSEIPLEAP